MDDQKQALVSPDSFAHQNVGKRSARVMQDEPLPISNVAFDKSKKIKPTVSESGPLPDEDQAAEVSPVTQKYSNIIAGIVDVRANDEAALTNPLWWGIIDLREERVSPLPDLPRAKQFLPDAEVDELRQLAIAVILEESSINLSAAALLEALTLSDIISLRTLGRENGARGIAGVCALLESESRTNGRADEEFDVRSQMQLLSQHLLNALSQSDFTKAQNLHTDIGYLLQRRDKALDEAIKGSEEFDDRARVRQALPKVNVNDDDTVYVGKCLEDVHAWVHGYNGASTSERTVDMHLVGPLSKAPNIVFSYGETHSDADREEKSSRSDSIRSGKPCDFIFWSHDREAGVGENTGPKYKDHQDKVKTDFVDIIKVARAQHIRLHTQCIEHSGCNPLPLTLHNILTLITMPFFQIVGMRIRFYILIQVNGDVYAIWEWASEDLPKYDSDLGDNLLNRVGRLSNIVIKKAKMIRNSIKLADTSENVVLNQMQTPTKPKPKR
ncbi:hypothetical protein BC936DRAFT_148525 [Jimgerdemannia flammicorona]|uniref:Uncharacterized protein n=1 Tax=Jimgerdemannia flammicorona TaxID=994334 RepID=A0A433DKP0_9FUNG|nr:hypothetical protein BC936DRAFT_148525 [Jimgerdemannia flammicorona]